MKPRIPWPLRVAAVGLAALLAATAPAHAQSGDPEIDRGVGLYKDLEYEQAIAVLEPALAAPGLTTAQKTTGYLHLAMAHLALRNEEAARKAFRALLEADRNYVLPADASQTARELLDEVARTMPRPAQVVVSTGPADPRDGATITVAIQVTNAAGRDARVVVHHRVRGGKGWSTVTAQRAGSGWSAAIPGAFVKAPAVEYWVAASDPAGAPLAAAGSAEAPLIAMVGERAAGGGGSILGKWWFWTGAGAVVAAGVVGGVLLFGGDDGGGGDSTVIITVQPPP